MMKWILSFCFLMSAPTMVQAARTAEDGAEELSYDDLVSQLSAHKKTIVPREESPFDSVKIHGGMAMVNAFSTFSVGDRNVQRSETGLQLSLGVDLFSPVWMAEVAFRNFGLTKNGTEEHSLREMDLKFAYQNIIEGPWSYRLQSGLAQRSLQLTDSSRDLSVSADTPALLGAVGSLIQMSPTASVNLEAGVRLPVVGRTSDKGSFDIGVEFRLSL